MTPGEMPAEDIGPRDGGLDRAAMVLVSAGHGCADLGQTAVAALIPFLVADRGYSVGSAAALVLAVTVSSSVVQPLFGHLSDRRSLAWTMVAGLVLEGAGFGLVGICHSHLLTFMVVLASGLGIAAYHPEASRYASYASGRGRATGMSWFSVGGNLGLALGPALVAPAVLIGGLGGGTAIVGAVPIAMGLTIASRFQRLTRLRPAVVRAARREHDGVDRWGPFGRLAGVIALRSTVDFGLITFVPLYYVDHLGESKVAGDTAITIMLLAGAVGTLVGGRLADRIGRRPVLVGAMGLLTCLLVAFHLSGSDTATEALALAGTMTVATYSVTVVMGHEYLPSHLGIASGVTLGLAIGFGGIVAALLGLLADSVGIGAILWGLAGLPLIAMALSFTLPVAVDGTRLRAIQTVGPEAGGR